MSEPVRVQLPRKKGWRMPPNTVKVDRSTGFGNPFPVVKGTSTSMGKTDDIWCIGTWEGPGLWFRDSKEEAFELSVKAFRAWITHPAQEELLDRAKAILAGKNLACWCKIGSPCHGDVLLELANTPPTVNSGDNPP